MPFHIIEDMKKVITDELPNVIMHEAAGEFMKAGVLTKEVSKGGTLHSHPEEEEWSYITKGKMHFVLGDEEQILEPGDFIHIPRNVKHRSRAIGGPVVYFSVKSPVHEGGMRDSLVRTGGKESEQAEQKFDAAVKAKS